MTVYLLHIYDRNGNSVFEKEWCRRKSSNLSKEQEQKLVFGMIHSIKSFVSKMAPRDGYVFRLDIFQLLTVGRCCHAISSEQSILIDKKIFAYFFVKFRRF